MSPAERSEELRAIARASVHETLIALGIDASDPVQTQADFATMRELVGLARDPEYRKDWEHVRWWRNAMRTVIDKGIGVAVITGLGTIGTALVLGIKALLARSTP